MPRRVRAPGRACWPGCGSRSRAPRVRGPRGSRPFCGRGARWPEPASRSIVALNLEMAPIGAVPLPDSSDVGAVTASTPAGHGSGLRHWEGRAPAAGTGLVNEAPGSVIWVPNVNEQLPLGRDRAAGRAARRGGACARCHEHDRRSRDPGRHGHDLHRRPGRPGARRAGGAGCHARWRTFLNISECARLAHRFERRISSRITGPTAGQSVRSGGPSQPSTLEEHGCAPGD